MRAANADERKSTAPLISECNERKLLIIDDEPDILVICTKALSRKFKVDSFSNPSEALEHFKANPADYDLILTDVRMPLISGLELAKEVRSIRPDIPILFMTAFEILKSECEKIFPSANDDSKQLISKPFSIAKLEQLVFSTIKGK